MTDVPTFRSHGYRVALVVNGQEIIMTRAEARELRTELTEVLADKPPTPPAAQKSALLAA
jgi:hypothetical protein